MLCLTSCDRDGSTGEGQSAEGQVAAASGVADRSNGGSLDDSPPSGEGTSARPPRLAPELVALVEDCLERIAAAPDDVELRLELGMIYDANAILGLARDAYLGVTLEFPDEPRGWYHLASCQAELGDTAAAIESMQRAVNKAPGFAPALGRLGLWSLESGLDEQAAQAFARARQSEPDHPVGHEGAALLALAAGDPQKAIGLLELYLSTHSDRGHARFLLGTAYRDAGRLVEAQTQLRRAQGSSPAWRDPWMDAMSSHTAGYRAVMDRAVALGQEGRAAAAIEELEILIQSHEDDVAVLEKLVGAYLQEQRLGDARTLLMSFIGRHRQHPRPWFLVALVEEAAGDDVEALSAVSRSLGLQPSWVPSHELKARLHWKQGDLELAAASLEQALHVGGAQLDALLKLGRARRLLFEWSAARAAYVRAVEAFPDSPEARIALLDLKQRGKGGAR
jgi:tetratricopeptide (TPR) repeat protein